MPQRRSTHSRLQKAVGKCIRSARLHARMTQDEAAAKARIDYKRWQRLEQGAVNATVATLHRVAKALGTDFWSLLAERGGSKHRRGP